MEHFEHADGWIRKAIPQDFKSGYYLVTAGCLHKIYRNPFPPVIRAEFTIQKGKFRGVVLEKNYEIFSEHENLRNRYLESFASLIYALNFESEKINLSDAVLRVDLKDTPLFVKVRYGFLCATRPKV